jgi:hypothetical protein
VLETPKLPEHTKSGSTVAPPEAEIELVHIDDDTIIGGDNVIANVCSGSGMGEIERMEWR